MRCDNCGKDTAYNFCTSTVYGKVEKLLVIEDVPGRGCTNCGMDLMTNLTGHQLSLVRRHPTTLAEPRPVRVITFTPQPAVAEEREAVLQTA